MGINLKALYKLLIEDRKHENGVGGWHLEYKDFHSKVAQIRKRIENGEGLSNEKDKDFLRELLYDQWNVASRGQSTLSKENFEAFIANEKFLSSLEKLICKPSADTHKEFGEVWKSQKKRNNPLRVNRVAAASTLDVSTTVDIGQFNEVFKWLTDEEEGDIDPYPAERDDGWFSKNKYLLDEIKKKFREELEDGSTDEFYLSQFVLLLSENIGILPFSLGKQTVKYGAPGTGKTYGAGQEARDSFKEWKGEFDPDGSLTSQSQIELVQFHPSYSYEDFMEGLRPSLVENGAVQLALKNGVFKEFCRKAGKWEIDVYNLDDPKLSTKKWEELKIKDLLPHKEKLLDEKEHWEYIFKAPDSKLVSDAVPPFFFIIDEINRAELSRVFGELMYCLEYRGIEGKIRTQYANLNTKNTGMLHSDWGLFFIPTNVYLIGTMNTIDRSVESFDYALRRRFQWKEMFPDTKLLRGYLEKYHYGDLTPLADNLEKLNEKIVGQPLLGRDYQIGHAYLMNIKYARREDSEDKNKKIYGNKVIIENFRKQVWDDRICPLLQEYLRGTGSEGLVNEEFKKAFGL